MSHRYLKSEQWLERALKTIPLGSQTFSKSKTQYPHGVSPFFIEKGLGSHVWDVDGNEYVDFVNSLAAITLGHNDPDVTGAVSTQLEQGTLFSLPHRLEVEVAEQIVKMVPCAEMVRFGKNGSDATTGAVRLARALTGRDHVALCGYHGWQDWSIGVTSRHQGVPEAVRGLSHAFQYNDLDSLHQIFVSYPDQIAAVILEPMNVEFPRDGFLHNVRKLCDQYKTLLIFDEVVTGFRLALGGAQDLLGVTPDLACFGKGLANGFPLSAIAGREKFMNFYEEVFFSFTFGGDALALAAALATLKKLEQEPVLQNMAQRGLVVKEGTERLLKQWGLEEYVTISGHPAWSFLRFRSVSNVNEWEVKTLFLQEVFCRGILSLGTHNMSYAHSDSDVECLLRVYGEVFPIIADAVHKKDVLARLHCVPLRPLFKVRG